MIRITAKQEGFRRCGVNHPATTTEYPDSRFSAKELKILQAEPMLVVDVVAGGKPAGSEAEKQLNVGDTVALVLAAATVEELDKFADDTRKGVIDAVAKRRADLAGPAE